MTQNQCCGCIRGLPISELGMHQCLWVVRMKNQTATLPNNHAVKRKPGCFNRSRSALSAPYIVPAGFKEDGSKRYSTVRTTWNDAATGACSYARTDEGKADSDCDGCVWRVR